jgi:hypothetical protein
MRCASIAVVRARHGDSLTTRRRRELSEAHSILPEQNPPHLASLLTAVPVKHLLQLNPIGRTTESGKLSTEPPAGRPLHPPPGHISADLGSKLHGTFLIYLKGSA